MVKGLHRSHRAEAVNGQADAFRDRATGAWSALNYELVTARVDGELVGACPGHRGDRGRHRDQLTSTGAAPGCGGRKRAVAGS